MVMRIIALSVLVAACASAILLALPTISRNIDNPGMITYFSPDEGYLMDLAWRYYSGERRPSYQNDLDYGLEMVYLTDAARLFLSRFIRITPGTFVLILRWLHLLSWVGALIALWCLVGYHFGKGWQQIAAVLLLWSRPAFNYFMLGLKPDPLVLLLIIIGLDYTLRIIDRPCWNYMLAAVACASAAIVVKFAGIFLLPAIVTALYFGYSRQSAVVGPDSERRPFMRSAWTFPAVAAIPVMAAPLVAIFFYVRKSTGLTYYQEFGLFKSVMAYKIIFVMWFAGISLVALSAAIFFLNRSSRLLVKKVMKPINEVSSYYMTVSLLCAGFLVLFGFRWITMPAHLLETYAVTGVDFAGCDLIKTIHTVPAFLSVLMKNIAEKSVSFGLPVLFLSLVSVAIDAHAAVTGSDGDKIALQKRATLAFFASPVVFAIFSIGRFVQLHMLPFFVGASVLAVQALPLDATLMNKRKAVKRLACFIMLAAIIGEIGAQGSMMIKERRHEFDQREDVAYLIDEWWRENIPAHSRIVSDHYVRAYIPPAADNVRVVSFSSIDILRDLRALTDLHAPRYVYYNENVGGKKISISDIVPGKKTKLVKAFDSSSRPYQRIPCARFVIYEILK